MQLVFCLEMGGLENLVLNLISKLNKTKYNISICSLTMNGSLEKRFNNIGIPVYHIKKREGIDYTLSFRLARLLKQKKIDLIHTHNPAPWLYGTIAAKMARVKGIVHTEHSNLFFNQRRLIFAEKILSKITDVIISDSKKVTQSLVNRQGIDSKKIRIIFNGIDVNRFQKEIDVKSKKIELGIRGDSLVIGNVARLETIKDHITLLDAFNYISKEIPEAILVIVGDGSLREFLKTKVVRLGIEDKVYFLGTRNDIPEIMKIFDFFVLSSTSEGLSLSLLEAMAAGKPIVTTDVGGNPEVVVDGVTGLLVPPKDPEKMAEAIIKIMQNPELAKQMGEVGRKRVEEKFSLERMVRQYEEVYEEYLIKKGVL